MTPTVITSNLYLKTAVTQLFEKDLAAKNICLIDFDEQLTLHGLLDILKKNIDIEKARVVFVGTPSLFRGFVLKHDWIDLSLPLNNIRKQISKVEGVTVCTLKDDIYRYLSLRIFSPRQARISLLTASYEVSDISLLTGESEKSIYCEISNIMRKISLRSINHLRYFMMREFRVRKKINITLMI